MCFVNVLFSCARCPEGPDEHACEEEGSRGQWSPAREGQAEAKQGREVSGAEAGQRLFERARQPTQRERAAAHSVGRGSAAASLGTRTRHAGAESVRFAPVCACARAGAFPLWRARPRLHAACPSRPPVAHEHTLSRTARQALGGGGGAPRAGQSTCCAVSGSAASASAATRSSVRALAIVSSSVSLDSTSRRSTN